MARRNLAIQSPSEYDSYLVESRQPIVSVDSQVPGSGDLILQPQNTHAGVTQWENWWGRRPRR